MAEEQRKKELELEELKEQDLIEWFESLYEKETFEVEKLGKVFKFKKHYSVKTLTKIHNLEKVTQIKYLISVLSIEPKITLKALEYMDNDFLTKISLKIKEFNDLNLGKNQGASEQKST